MNPMDIIAIATITILGSAFVGSNIYLWNKDKKRWNNGICPDCGKPWKLIGIDYMGNRCYTCDEEHHCIIYYHSVDKLGE